MFQILSAIFGIPTVVAMKFSVVIYSGTLAADSVLFQTIHDLLKVCLRMFVTYMIILSFAANHCHGDMQ